MTAVYTSRVWILAAVTVAMCWALWPMSWLVSVSFGLAAAVHVSAPGVLITRDAVVVPQAPWRRWRVDLTEIRSVSVIAFRDVVPHLSLEITMSDNSVCRARHLRSAANEDAASELRALARAIEAKSVAPDSSWSWSRLVWI